MSDVLDAATLLSLHRYSDDMVMSVAEVEGKDAKYGNGS